jgi:hypothetical protein
MENTVQQEPKTATNATPKTDRTVVGGIETAGHDVGKGFVEVGNALVVAARSLVDAVAEGGRDLRRDMGHPAPPAPKPVREPVVADPVAPPAQW